jgi:cytochrome c peroxidase
MASTTSRTFARAALRASARNTAFTTSRQTFRRGYSSAPPAAKSYTLYYLGGLLGAAGAGYYVYGQSNGFSVAAAADKGPFTPTFEDYQKVYNEIAARLEEKDDYDDGSYGPVLLRLAWHASGTYDKETKTGGSNGATMRFAPEGDHGANAGLKAARDFLEPVKGMFSLCPLFPSPFLTPPNPPRSHHFTLNILHNQT